MNQPTLTNTFKQGKKLILATSISLALSGCCLNQITEDAKSQENTLTKESYQDENLIVSTEDLNDLHLIFHNLGENEIDWKIFDTTVTKLRDWGVKVIEADRYDNSIRNADSTIITIAGPSVIQNGENTKILGPYFNETESNSDILVLAMQAGFKHNNVPTAGISCGYSSIDPLASEKKMVTRPTGTEQLMDKSSSFVSIALGSNVGEENIEAISNSIIQGLVRATYEIKDNPKKNYLHRITDWEVQSMEKEKQPSFKIVEHIAVDCFHIEPDILINANPNLEENSIQIDNVIIHPDFYHTKAFIPESNITITKTKINKSK